MNRQSKMIKTTIIYFIGNFASKLLAFFLLPLYTAYLTPEDFGNVDVFMSTLPLIAPIFTLQVTESIFRFLCNDKTNTEKESTVTNSLAIFIFGILLFLIIYIPLVIKFRMKYPILFLLYFIITYISIFMQQILRGFGMNLEYALSGIIMTIVQAAGNIILIVNWKLRGESLLIAATSASLIVSIIVSMRLRIWKFIRIKYIDKNKIIEQLKYGIPLIPNQICWWIIGLLGKYLLLYYSGSNYNGILAVATKFPALLTTINSIFFLAWTENIIKEFNSEDRDNYFSESFNMFIIFSISISCCLLPMIKIYNLLTISGEFNNSWIYIPPLYIGALFNGFSSFIGTAYTASMKTTQAFTTTVVAAVSNLILSLLLIPNLSIWGVIVANMFSFIIFFIVRLESINNIIIIKINFIDKIPIVILFTVAIIIYYSFDYVGQIIFLLVASIIIFNINKKFICNLLRKILDKYKNMKLA